MAEEFLQARIVVSRDICHGKPRIAGTRIMVYQILDMLADGLSVEEITSEDYFPDITSDDVLACGAYAKANKGLNNTVKIRKLGLILAP